MTDFEFTVVGGGVIGLSIAKSLSSENKKVLLIEKNNSFGQENSSRNSGVIHAGLYYIKNSLKEKLCIQGRHYLYKYIKDRGIKYDKCGKIIVASSLDEIQKLKFIKKNAERLGIELVELDKKNLKEMEPDLNGSAGLFSRETGIVDVHQLMANFLIDVENNGGTIVFNTEFSEGFINQNSIDFIVNNQKNDVFKTKVLINCSGLNSYRVAKSIKNFQFKIPKIRFVKGNYMKLEGDSPFSRLIYPIPQKDGLGIHSTICLSGETHFGPDTEQLKSVNFDVSRDLENKFKKSISKYWSKIKDRNLVPDYSGIRTKIVGNDFCIQNNKINQNISLINLFGIESPGLTSSIAIGEFVKNLVIENK